MTGPLKNTFLFLLLLGIFACQPQDSVSPTPPTGVLIDTKFAEGTSGWEADYTDYASVQEASIEFSASHTGLPAPLNSNQKAFRLFGRNRSDDLFMFIRKQLTGLAPNTLYQLRFEIELASLYPANSVGIGGSPGSSVFLKAGASATKPEKVRMNDFYSLSVDKGNQLSGGARALVLGDVANGKDITEYTLIQRTNANELLAARSNNKGELWLFVGTDSGFEGDQALYYTRIKVSAL